ncbi:hypothetical protein BpHYR1_022817 [Brachionus plicatilis]|uniref:Uncharacterized protein n=1 Tax=Brachionus plicatilis TaxID=10195 RepID=A0A3M7PGP8_BRAPC|nr:hypothetical protein BpHYR1_022817 [Brachionus plicatilis]
MAKLKGYFNHKSGQHVYLRECIKKQLVSMIKEYYQDGMLPKNGLVEKIGVEREEAEAAENEKIARLIRTLGIDHL